MPTNSKGPYLNPKQKKFVANYVSGKTVKDSAIIAGYKTKTPSVTGNRLLKMDSIRQAIDNSGISDQYLSDEIKDSIEVGKGIQASETTRLKAIELILKLKGYLDSNIDKDSNIDSTTNIYIKELKLLSDTELKDKINALEADITG